MTKDAKRPASAAFSEGGNHKIQKVDDLEEEFDTIDASEGLNDEALIAATEAVETEASDVAPASLKALNGSQSAADPISKNVSTQSELKPSQDLATDLLALERKTMASDWFRRLESEMQKPYFVELKKFLASEDKAGRTTYPPPQLVHSWSRLTPIEKVKVVVVGQDPYHGDGQACGLSFSVPKGVTVPPSLKNIYKELTTEYPGKFKAPSHGCLDEWAKQGVLLLNASLTVSAKLAGSHHGKGWEKLTKHVLKLVADQAGKDGKQSNKGGAAANSQIASMFAKVSAKQTSASQKHAQTKEPAQDGNGKTKNENDNTCKGVVFLAWGAPAAKTLAEAGVTEKSPNVLILRSPHPSPLSAHRGFLGNGHFLAANKWLEQQYGSGGGIDWSRL